MGLRCPYPTLVRQEQAGTLAAVVQEATGRNVELAYVRPRIHRGESVEEARRHGIRLEVVKHPEDK
jgi:hypothetical protein